MTTRTKNEGTDALLAEWAELLRQRHGLANASALEFEARVNAEWEGDEAKQFSHRLTLAPGMDDTRPLLAIDTCVELQNVFIRYVTDRIAVVEALLSEHNIAVRRPGSASEPTIASLTKSVSELQAELDHRDALLAEAKDKVAELEASMLRPTPLAMATEAYGWQAADLIDAVLDAEPRSLPPGDEQFLSRLALSTTKYELSVENWVLLARLARTHTSVAVRDEF